MMPQDVSNRLKNLGIRLNGQETPLYVSQRSDGFVLILVKDSQDYEIVLWNVAINISERTEYLGRIGHLPVNNTLDKRRLKESFSLIFKYFENFNMGHHEDHGFEDNIQDIREYAKWCIELS